MDPGSSHNFLDSKIASDFGIHLEEAPPYRVNAAFENQLTSAHKCSKFSWKVQGYTFTTEVRTIPLDCCDLILGVQWLVTLGPILWDFSNLRMEFQFEGLKHILRGVAINNFKLIKGRSLNKIMTGNPQIALLQVHQIQLDQNDCHSGTLDPTLFNISVSSTASQENPQLQQLLTTFSDLFENPTTLPPFREGFDHKIPIIDGSLPVNKRPYRYSSLQKNAIDKLIRKCWTRE